MISIFEIGNTVMNIIFLMREIQEPRVLGGVWGRSLQRILPYLPHQLLKRGQKLVDGFVLAFADVLRDAGLDVVGQQHL